MRRFSLSLLALSLLLLTGCLSGPTKIVPPTTSGALSVQGLHAPGSILRDRFGVPTVEAASLRDAFFLQGFAQGQDRAFLLEMFRRAALGELSGIFGNQSLGAPSPLGESTLALDRAARRIGFGRWGQDMAAWLAGSRPESYRLLEAFSAGVNAAWREARDRDGRTGMSWEYEFLDFDPHPWTPAHSLAIFQFMAWNFSGDWALDLARLEVALEKGPEGLWRWLPVQVEASHAILKAPWLPEPMRTVRRIPRPTIEGTERYIREVLKLSGDDERKTTATGEKGLSDLLALRRAFRGTGTNLFAVSGRASASGLPMLANDPHAGLVMPSTFCDVRIRCPEIEAAGVSLCGLPGILIGQNERVAWGLSDSFADSQDVLLVPVGEEGTELTTVRDTIPVAWLPTFSWKSYEPVERKTTEEGWPVLMNRVYEGRRFGVAVRWPGFQRFDPVRVLADLLTAESAPETLDAYTNLPAPALNVVAVDREGGMGYVCTGGRFLARDAGPAQALLPERYAPNEAPEWVAFPDTTRVVWDAETAPDVLVASNQPIRRLGAEEGFPVLGSQFGAAFRASRARKLLEKRLNETRSLTADDLRDVQMDIRAPEARWLAPHFAAALDAARKEGPVQRLSEMAAELQNWTLLGAPMAAGLPGPLIYAAMVRNARYLLQRPGVGLDVFPLVLGSKSGPELFWEVLEHRTPRSPHFSGGAIDRKTLVRAALLTENQLPGGRPETWHYGDLHGLDLVHPFGRRGSPLRWLLDSEFVPLDGGPTCLQNTHALPFSAEAARPEATDPGPLNLDVVGGSVFRYVVDLAASKKATMAHFHGQQASGLPHERDQVEEWRRGNRGEKRRLLYETEETKLKLHPR